MSDIENENEDEEITFSLDSFDTIERLVRSAKTFRRHITELCPENPQRDSAVKDLEKALRSALSSMNT